MESAYSFAGLLGCTDYEAQLRTNCSDDLEYSESVFFTTLGCGACTDETYCEFEEVDSSEEWIAQVVIADLDNSSGGSAAGYEDFTGGDATTDLAAGETYTCTLTPGYAGTAYNEYFQVFVDLDHDGEFDGPGELVYDSGTAAPGEATGEITIPSDATIGLTRLRVVMSYNTAPASCAFNATFGEAEDYCVTIISAVSVEEELLSEWTLSPNPTSNSLFVSLSHELSNETLDIAILDISGKTLRTEMNLAGGESRHVFDLDDLSDGMYFLRVSDENGNYRTKRFIKR